MNSDIKIIMLDGPAILKKHHDSMWTLQRTVTSHLLELGFHVQSEHHNTSTAMSTGTNYSLNTDDIIIVFNKCDLLETCDVVPESTVKFKCVSLSCATGKGIPQLLDLLTQKVKEM